MTPAVFSSKARASAKRTGVASGNVRNARHAWHRVVLATAAIWMIECDAGLAVNGDLCHVSMLPEGLQ